MEQLKIRAEASTDIAAIATVTSAAFLNAAHTSHTEQAIVHALRAAGDLTISLVAEENGIVIGHVAISPVSISDGTTNWFGLGPVSVLPRYQRRGVGTALVGEAIRLLRQRGASGCVVLGYPSFYVRFGFRVDTSLVLPGVTVEHFQILPFDASKPRGRVSYSEAFNAR